MMAIINSLDNELSKEEMDNLKERMCGNLKPRKLTQEEIEQLKREGRI